jgi:hypothetical protein
MHIFSFSAHLKGFLRAGRQTGLGLCIYVYFGKGVGEACLNFTLAVPAKYQMC